MSITKIHFGEYRSSEIYKYTLSNGKMSVEISNYGATVLSIKTPDRYGILRDVACGYDDIRSYIEGDGYQGAIIGRVGNRICGGEFELDGKKYHLATNDGKNHLHGGNVGFDKRVWDVISINDADEPEITLGLISPDGDEGYPGRLSVEVTYTLTLENEFCIKYRATTDVRTPINLTNHTYFNLGGCGSGKIHGHILQIDADTYLPTDRELIPTGEIRSVAGTPFDFREAKEIGRDIAEDNEDLSNAKGYDHCFNFTGGEPNYTKFRARVYEPTSGRVMELYTDQPCVQFYTGNFLTNEKYPFRKGCKQTPQTAFCLETQHMPDAVNHPNFTNVVLDPEDIYEYTTVYKFSIQ